MVKLLSSRAGLLHVAERRGEGPAVIMIHGIASSSATFQNVFPLIEGSHQCFAIDLLGFGGSPVPENSEYTIAEHVNALARVISSLKLREPFILVGHSMGALIAARYAAQFSRRVSKVVLVSPPIYVVSTELSNAVDRNVMEVKLKASQFLRRNKEFTLRQARILERLLPIPETLNLTEKNWTPFVRSLENCIESQTTISDLAAVRAPVEIVYGSLDQFASDGGLKIVSRMSGVSVHRVEGSDHLIGKRLARVVAIAVRSDPQRGLAHTKVPKDQARFSRHHRILQGNPYISPARSTSRLESYVYGNVLILAAIATADRAAVESGAAVAYVLGTAASTFCAHVLAVVVAHREPDPQIIRHSLRDSLPIATSALVPVVILGSASLGWPSPQAAIVIAIGALLVRFMLLGTVASYVSGERRGWRNFGVGIALAIVALAVAAFKLWATS